MNASITIIGGGLAGLTLGIGLRQRGVPVTLWEAGNYPRHRVCGEFISGRGQQVLRSLRLEGPLLQEGAIFAKTAIFRFGEACSPLRPVAPPALCLSRFQMDDLLAKIFRENGGELRPGTRWQEEKIGEGVVDASGRHVQPDKSGFQWLGLKAHARNVSLDADLEMHGSRNQYIGVSRLPDGKVNVCGLFRRRADERAPVQWQEILRGPPGSPLRNRLEKAVFDKDSFCSVAGFSLEPRRASGMTECPLGDALTMIPPVTGNGMSMALESAALALDPLTAYSRGEISWQAARTEIADACDSRFARRLRWARRLQKLMFLLPLSGYAGNTLLRWEWSWTFMFTRTR